MSAPRTWLAAIAALGLLLASTSHAATITTLAVALLPANGADLFSDTAAAKGAASSAVDVVASDATSFSTRYAMALGVDAGQIAPAASLSESFTASYQITLEIVGSVGEVWALLLDTGRSGALTIVDDGLGSASATLGGVTATTTGGTLAGSLDLASAGTTTNSASATTSPDAPFQQLASAVLSGIGTGAAQTVTLSFTWTANTTSTRQGNNGDEAAVRMGQTSALTSFSADDYPGAGARTQALDGHFVSATLVPEPHTAMLLLSGLTGLAWSSRRRR